MPVTRSNTRAASSTTVRETVVIKTPKANSATKKGKRKVAEDEDEQANPDAKTVKKARVTKTVKATTSASTVTAAVTTSVVSTAVVVPIPENQDEEDALVPAQLSFSFEDAKAHLISADARFEDIFERLACQQISWLAARAIKHKFIRLFNPEIPENPADYSDSNWRTGFFPTPSQVAQTDLVTLRTAGLSQRKAEYIHDLAARFSDGRLSTKKLLAADDEELAQMLIEVRGIGRWTVDMFAMFSLRRPDILPVGDLGVQRGMVRWFLAQHSPSYNVAISPQKELRKPKSTAENGGETQPPADLSSLPPAPPETPKRKNKKAKISDDAEVGDGTIPPPFTPSIKRTLGKPAVRVGDSSPFFPPALPEGLSVADLKTRLDGKKKIKGALLTPSEMEALSESWRPYRSLAVYYMWALADAELGEDA
ncbi:hypothetical protein V5O48_000113 [Marasmius crinis-equi]|uniref:HhH-GPD domain-containing protein n=1 Tax=Marasmius crinis-equi TaxID=585013 RepID=A0ABR3G212_9AGAR